MGGKGAARTGRKVQRRVKCQGACKPGSVARTVSHERPYPHWQPFLSATCCHAAPATNPGGRVRNRPALSSAPPLFGLAPGGVCRAAPVASRAVRSCRTLSPLPAGTDPDRRSALCGTFPGVTPGGRYPPPLFRGARTFLVIRRWRGCPAPWRRSPSTSQVAFQQKLEQQRAALTI